MRQKLQNTEWENEIKKKCMDLIKGKDLDNINMDEISKQLLEFGATKVPPMISNEMEKEIKNRLMQDESYKKFLNEV